MPARLPIPTVQWRDAQPWLSGDAGAPEHPVPGRAQAEQRCLAAHGFGTASQPEPGRWSVSAGAQARWIFADTTANACRNFLVTWAAFRAHAQRVDQRAQLEWVGVEHAPLDSATLLRAAMADAAMLDLEPLARELQHAWPERIPGVHRRAFDRGRVRLTLLFGQPAKMLPRMHIPADVWIRGGTAGAPSPASARALPAWFAQPAPTAARSAVVIGAGLAGAAAARALAERGLDVHVLDSLAPAAGASGAPRAVLAPHVASWAGVQTRVVAHAFLHARALLQRLNVPHEPCGLLHPLAEDDVWAHEQAVEEWGWPHELLRVATPAEAEQLAGVPLGVRTSAPESTALTGRAAVWVPLACVTQPALTVHALLDHPAIVVHSGVEVNALQRTPHGWRLHTEAAPMRALTPARAPTAAPDSGVPQESPIVILATAGAWTPRRDQSGALIIDRTAPLAPAAMPDVPFDTTRGQLTQLADPAVLAHGAPAPRAVISANGFVMPPRDGLLCAGATYERDTDDLRPSSRDDALNVEALERLVPALYDERTAPIRAGAWTGLRATVRDHCPVVGAVHDSNAFRSAFAPLCDGPFAAQWSPAPLLPGLFATLAHGSRGTSTALLAGELLADIATGGVRCVPDDLLPALLPQRFLVRALRRSEGEAVP